MKIKQLALVAAVALGLTSLASAQTTTASITGTVADPSGAVVPNVKVTATNNGTNINYTASSNDAGVFNLLFLPVGRYSVAAETQGFKKVVLGPFPLEVNQIARIDVKLEVGDTTQSVEVKDFAPILQTESTQTGDSLTASRLPPEPPQLCQPHDAHPRRDLHQPERDEHVRPYAGFRFAPSGEWQPRTDQQLPAGRR